MRLSYVCPHLAQQENDTRPGCGTNGVFAAEAGIISLAPSEAWLHPLGTHPTEVEQMMGEIILRVMAWAAQAELESIKRRIEAGVRRAAEEGRFPGRPKALTPDQTAAIRLLRRNGQSQSGVAMTFGVSRQTVWRAERTE